MSIQHEREGAARFFLDSCGVAEVPTPLERAAEKWGYSVSEGRFSGTAGPLISIDGSKSHHRKRWDLAHELGHIIARHCGLDEHCEATANRLASAILMPWICFGSSVSELGWDLRALSERYDVSHEAAAWRLKAIRCASVTIWDNGRLVSRGGKHSTPTTMSLAQQVFEHVVEASADVRDDSGLVRGYWLPEGQWRRIIVVCGVEALSSELWATQAVPDDAEGPLPLLRSA